MKVLLVGAGGRESALARAIARYGHELVTTGDNPGFHRFGRMVRGDPFTVAEREAVDLVVVGPEGPLAEGLVDRLTAVGIPAFGPTAAAARLEASKVYTKELALKYRLPTARAQILRRGDAFAPDRPYVVKLDGLAAGKGVWVPDTAGDTRAAVEAAFALRPDAAVLVEERLVGPELSVMGISDGDRVVPFPAARDHKRRFDGDRGANTGGMGAIAPVDVGPAVLAVCHDVLSRAVQAMALEGTPFRGILYGGFMLTEEGPRLLEFNVRFGDPECQALMALWDEDPVPWFHGAATGCLPGAALKLRAGHACCVVVCGDAYPEGRADARIDHLPPEADDLLVDHAGTTLRGPELWATGGRVLGITGVGPSARAARSRAYGAVGDVRFEGAAWRLDIGR